jgi:hypothetical protein
LKLTTCVLDQVTSTLDLTSAFSSLKHSYVHQS